jgi:hypothetical protein
MEPATLRGSTAFIEDATHPAFANLQQKDFFTWARMASATVTLM